MFTDLVGSAGLEMRVGPAQADELRRTHFAIVRGVIANTGTEVKNLGDGFMVVFPAAASAATAAIAVQQAMDKHNRRSAERLYLRIGVSAGDITSEDGDYFGRAVIEAARLCALAQPEQIL